MKHLKFYPVLMLLFGIAFSGCISELTPPDPIAGDDEVLITIRVPGPSSGNNTRAIPQGGAEDNRVDRVDILLFDNAGTKLYRGRVWSTHISGAGNTKTFTVRVPRRADGSTYDMLVLANAQDIIDAATLTVGITTLANVEAGLLQGSVTSGVGWNVVPGSGGYRPFPMWSRVENFNPSAATPSTLSIELVRMLAKINVSFSSAAVAARLQIDQITLVNYNTRGLLTSRNWNNAPRMPDPAADTYLALGLANGINYTVSAADRANWANLVRDRIFLFERARPVDPTDVTQRRNSVALIIRGVYKGDDPSNTTPTYYRIDMANSAGTYFDIVRNHFYEVVITAVNGQGYATGQQAFDNRPFNIITAIDAWNEDGMNIHTYDGRYQITVDYDAFTFSSTPTSSQPLRIYTDFPGGWTLQIPPTSNWITVTPGTGGSPVASTTVQVSTGSFTGIGSRVGSFFIIAGNLRKEINVTQRGVVWAQTNVDASQSSGFAASPGDFGSFFQWNRRTAWNNGTALQIWSTATWGTGAWQAGTWTGTNAAGTVWEAVNNPCPAGWRLPVGGGGATDEFQALLNASDVGTDGQRGQWLDAAQATALGFTNPGRLFGTGINPIPASFDPSTMLFLPAAGWRNSTDGALFNPGASGVYWSSTPGGTTHAWGLTFGSGFASVGNSIRAFGLSVRCVSE